MQIIKIIYMILAGGWMLFSFIFYQYVDDWIDKFLSKFIKNQKLNDVLGVLLVFLELVLLVAGAILLNGGL